jgi:hypothetical protein
MDPPWGPYAERAPTFRTSSSSPFLRTGRTFSAAPIAIAVLRQHGRRRRTRTGQGLPRHQRGPRGEHHRAHHPREDHPPVFDGWRSPRPRCAGRSVNSSRNRTRGARAFANRPEQGSRAFLSAAFWHPHLVEHRLPHDVASASRSRQLVTLRHRGLLCWEGRSRRSLLRTGHARMDGYERNELHDRRLLHAFLP